MGCSRNLGIMGIFRQFMTLLNNWCKQYCVTVLIRDGVSVTCFRFLKRKEPVHDGDTMRLVDVQVNQLEDQPIIIDSNVWHFVMVYFSELIAPIREYGAALPRHTGACTGLLPIQVLSSS